MHPSFRTLGAVALLLVGGAAQAQAPAPAAEVPALTARLNQLLRLTKPEGKTDILVSLANCGVRQIIRVYRAPSGNATANVAVSSTKNGSSWGVKTNDEVELELTFALDWAEVGTISHALKQDEKSGRRHYDLIIKRQPAANGKSSGGLNGTITLELYTDDEPEVASLERRLKAVREQCLSKRD